MTEAEYFHKALTDPGYRREKIVELREHRKFTLIGLVFMLVVVIFANGYAGIVQGKWFEGFGGMWGSVLLVTWVHTNIKTRLAALEAMEGKALEPAGNVPAPVAH